MKMNTGNESRVFVRNYSLDFYQFSPLDKYPVLHFYISCNYDNNQPSPLSLSVVNPHYHLLYDIQWVKNEKQKTTVTFIPIIKN